MDNWRTMDTAPQDGTRILAYVSSKPDEANVVEVWWEPDYCFDDYGVSVGAWDDDWDLSHRPKAWMPRPEKPKHLKELDT